MLGIIGKKNFPSIFKLGYHVKVGNPKKWKNMKGNSMTNLRILILSLTFGYLGFGCASNPNRARKIDTEIENNSSVGGEEQIGVKDGNLVVQKKVLMNEELRRLQNEVFETEDRVYGNRKFGSEGLYGVLKQCRIKLTSKAYGGDGKLIWTEPMDRVSDKEAEYEVGIDEKKKIVAVSEEFIKDRIKRFQEYKQILQKREDEYSEKIDICDAAMASRKHDLEAQQKVDSRKLESKNAQ